jgi:hypothetical protein
VCVRFVLLRVTHVQWAGAQALSCPALLVRGAPLAASLTAPALTLKGRELMYDVSSHSLCTCSARWYAVTRTVPRGEARLSGAGMVYVHVCLGVAGIVSKKMKSHVQTASPGTGRAQTSPPACLHQAPSSLPGPHTHGRLHQEHTSAPTRCALCLNSVRFSHQVRPCHHVVPKGKNGPLEHACECTSSQTPTHAYRCHSCHRGTFQSQGVRAREAAAASCLSSSAHLGRFVEVGRHWAAGGNQQ